ncbi:MAG: zf-TFIIB domain-containing protein [Elusimicrobiota bacterium]
MRCPKCSCIMEEVAHQGVTIDKCSGCQGLWFDMFEHDELKQLAAAYAVDTGDASIGREFNAKDDYDCPKCAGARMSKMVDAKQSHIWYEACSRCHGVFFDAGEFKDFSQEDFFDRVKSLLKKPRG